MTFNILKKGALFLALSFFGILFADSDSCCIASTPPPANECQEEDMYPALGDVPCAYNCPARIDITGCWDLYLTASFIYWFATEHNLDVITEILTSDPSHLYYKSITPDFEYKPGFKVGLGSYFDHDSWGLYVEYTRYHSKNKNHFNQTDPAISSNSNWTPTLAAATNPFEFNFDWNLDIDLVDFELSRPFYLGKMLTIVPHAGLRLAFVDQEYNLKRIFPDSSLRSTNNTDSDSWAIGPRFGLDSSWEFGSGFRFLGNIAGSLTYSSFDVKINAQPISTASFSSKSEDSFLTPNAEYALGFAWGRYFYDKSYYFDLMALYEFHVFWDANMMCYNACKNGNIYSKSGAIGNLFLHGLTITARFDF